MRWGSELRVPFERGELVQTWIRGEPAKAFGCLEEVEG